MANSVDSDRTPPSAASDLGLHCLFRHNYFKAEGKYDMLYYSTAWQQAILFIWFIIIMHNNINII